MLMVLFQLGSDRYAIDCKHVVEIIPLVTLKSVPHAPAHIAGLFNYRGSVVPVVDVRQLIQGSPCRAHLSTRIIMADYGRVIGLLAERVSEVREKPSTPLTAPIPIASTPFMGGIIPGVRRAAGGADNGERSTGAGSGEMIQFVEPAALLPDELREMLLAGVGNITGPLDVDGSLSEPIADK